MEQKMWYEPDSKKQKDYEEYLVKSGKVTAEKMAEITEKTGNWTKADFEAFKASADDLNKRLCTEMLKKSAVESEAVQALVAEHYQWVCRAWTPNRESYKGLAQMYLEYDDFRKFYDSYSPGLVDYLTKAMEIYADKKLQ